ncbi:uncharacterized protein LOC131213902 [Anopheles bellator]|uniref:uncharacterized protein LOC131213902 n=1 Tax=Anopheles bellator TaxID=139047 RepID=UPI00264A099B|nr:uncharacterized protein LOC131213902 [Anopheles bellator]
MSTSFNVGVAAEAKPSSRVLKPPGGGHSDIFGESDVRHNPPRPKNNQQNSSNMNAVMGTTDPNETLEAKPATSPAATGQNGPHSTANGSSGPTGGASAAEMAKQQASSDNQRVRVPPGGHSAGFW